MLLDYKVVLFIFVVVIALLSIGWDDVWVEVTTLHAMPTRQTQGVRALGLSFDDMRRNAGELDQLESRMRQIGINRVGLNAGRLDWNYFKWAGHKAQWSAAID